jgi:hypothetical protein
MDSEAHAVRMPAAAPAKGFTDGQRRILKLDRRFLDFVSNAAGPEACQKQAYEGCRSGHDRARARKRVVPP